MTLKNQLPRAALLLTLALAVQALRFILPLPGPFTMFLIGSLVNMCLLLTVFCSSKSYALISSALLPLVALLQGQLPFLPLVLVVFAGNAVFCLVAVKLRSWRLFILGPILKVMVLWAGTGLALQLLHITGPVATLIRFMMSWPQLITGCIGVVLAELVVRRLKIS